MCGIFCLITCNEGERCTQTSIENVVKEECLEVLRRRGPDCYAEKTVDVGARVSCQFAGSVLWMQGDQPTEQPIQDEQGNLLLWNGECFNDPWGRVAGQSDSAILAGEMSRAAHGDELLLETLAGVRGPFAFVYYDASRRLVWFGRDRVGRHSLLWGVRAGRVVLTSAGVRAMADLREVPTWGVFRVDLGQDLNNIMLFPWSDCDNLEYLPPISGTTISISPLKIQSPIFVPIATQSQPSVEDYTIFTQFEGTNLTSNEILDKLLETESITFRVMELIEHLKASVKVRIRTQPKLCKDCIRFQVKNNCGHAKTGVLFSGGLDSAILAVLADEFVPVNEPIDLINVAFERLKNPNVQKCKGKIRVNEETSEANCEYKVPDRVTGLQTLEELKTVRPHRTWNFIEADVTRAELSSERGSRVSGLIHPLDTVLDDSLGCALWFAARGKGTVGDQRRPHMSSARVLLLGMGADEQMGGYMRHRTTLARRDWPALAAELKYDTANIASRNLGRDDRVVADSGRQGRFPYLDEDVITHLSRLPVWHKCFPVPSLPPGIGDKLILRLVARSLGLEKASVLPKRAFQFGSRIANSQESGSDKSNRL